MSKRTARRQGEYEIKRVSTGWGGQKKVDKLLAKGWELVHHKRGFMGAASTFVLRRPINREES